MSSSRKYSRLHNKSLSKKLRTRSYRRPQKIAPFHILKGGSSNNNSDVIEQISNEERDALWTSIKGASAEVNMKQIIEYFVAQSDSDDTIKLIISRLGLKDLCNSVEAFEDEPCSEFINVALSAGYPDKDTQKNSDSWNEFIRLVNLYSLEKLDDNDSEDLWKIMSGDEDKLTLVEIKKYLIAHQEDDDKIKLLMKKLGAYSKVNSVDDFENPFYNLLNELAPKAGFVDPEAKYEEEIWDVLFKSINTRGFVDELKPDDNSSHNSNSSHSSSNSSNSSSNSPTTAEKYASMRNDYIYLLEELVKFKNEKMAKTASNDGAGQVIIIDIIKLIGKMTDAVPVPDTIGISDSDLDDLIIEGENNMKKIEDFFTYYNVKYNKPSDDGDEDFKHVNQLLETCEELKKNYEIKHEEVKLLGDVITALKTEFDELVKKKLNDKDLKSNIGLIQDELTRLKEQLQDPGLSKEVEGIQEMLKELPKEQAQVLGEVQKKVDNLVVTGMMNSTKKLHNSKTMGDLSSRLKTAIAKHPDSSSSGSSSPGSSGSTGPSSPGSSSSGPSSPGSPGSPGPSSPGPDTSSQVSGMKAPKSERKRTHKKKPRRKKGSRKSKGVKVSGLGNAKKQGTYIKISRKKRSLKKK